MPWSMQNPFPQIINPQVVVKRGGSINQIHNDITVKINTVGAGKC
jgi:hypothetical protein